MSGPSTSGRIRNETNVVEIDANESLVAEETRFSVSDELSPRFSQEAAEDLYTVTDDNPRALRRVELSATEFSEIVDCNALNVYTAYLKSMWASSTLR